MDAHGDPLVAINAAVPFELFLGCSLRYFLRLRSRYDVGGLEGLRDRRVGRVSRHRAADAEIAVLTRLHAERYAGFNMRQFHELAHRDHSLQRGYLMLSTFLDVQTGKKGQSSYLGESLPLMEAGPPKSGKLKRALGTLRRMVGLRRERAK